MTIIAGRSALPMWVEHIGLGKLFEGKIYADNEVGKAKFGRPKRPEADI